MFKSSAIKNEAIILCYLVYYSSNFMFPLSPNVADSVDHGIYYFRFISSQVLAVKKRTKYFHVNKSNPEND